MSATSTTSGEAVRAVRRFAELGQEDVAFAGGKGANLGELTRAGLPVPPGFVIGAPAYMAFCEAQGLRDRIAAELHNLRVDDTEALREVSTRVREMIPREPLPGWLEKAIRQSYDDLTGTDRTAAVAVRSSATAKDIESASFAGMNETSLNVRASDALVDAVRRCYLKQPIPRARTLSLQTSICGQAPYVYPEICRATRALRHRRDLGQHGRGRPHQAAHRRRRDPPDPRCGPP